MTETLDRFASNPLGHLIFKTVQPFVRAVRHFAHPDIPNHHMITRVSCDGRQTHLRHRRWCEDDSEAIRQCFESRQYDMPSGEQRAKIDQIYDRIISSGRKPLIIDCGANIGASVAWFALRYPQAHIVAVEPAPENFALLQLNSATFDIDLKQAGISAEDGRAYLRGGAGYMGYRISHDDCGIPVDTVSIGALVASKPASQYVPFLLKIDIEGAEKTVFAGDWTAINRFPLIIMEPHDWLFPGQHCSRDFFRFHVETGREFCMHHENIGSIAYRDDLEDPASAETMAMGHAQISGI